VAARFRMAGRWEGENIDASHGGAQRHFGEIRLQAVIQAHGAVAHTEGRATEPAPPPKRAARSVARKPANLAAGSRLGAGPAGTAPPSATLRLHRAPPWTLQRSGPKPGGNHPGAKPHPVQHHPRLSKTASRIRLQQVDVPDNPDVHCSTQVDTGEKAQRSMATHHMYTQMASKRPLACTSTPNAMGTCIDGSSPDLPS